jgi:peptidoglycan/xylan/chitin deacetylase (PgdA/CDA1 family)
LRSRFQPHALVLGYHRIASQEEDPYGLCTGPARFGEHLEVMRSEANPISLVELSEGLRVGRIPERCVVLTFDDGYSDVLTHGVPLLATHDVPATVFVTTGMLDREPWWDTLARALGRADASGESVDLRVGGRAFHWASPPTRSGRDGCAGRIQAVQSQLLDWPREARDELLSELERRLGSFDDDTASRGLTVDQLRELASLPLVEIGAHSVSHPMLAAIPEEEQREEIESSKRGLEALAGVPVRAFSYPNGSRTRRTRELVREAGFECACSSAPDVARRGIDWFDVPRFWPGKLDADRFAAWLRRWC